MKALLIVACVLSSTTLALAETPQERLTDAAEVFSEVMSTPDRGIPQDLLNKAECVIIIPGLKQAAFVVGGEYGQGFAECRKTSGSGWGAPAAVKMEGGSVGFQIGGSSTDLIMLVMDRRGMNKLMQDKITLGADASVAAGPVGRSANAATDVKLSAEILAWSRARGLFAGIALNGATLRPDEEANAKLYGRKMNTREVIMSNMQPPAVGRQLITELERYSARQTSGGTATREKR